MSSLAITFIIIAMASSLGSRTSAAPLDETSYDRNELKTSDEEATASPLTEAPMSLTKDEVKRSEDMENESRMNLEEEDQVEEEASRDARSENSPDADLEAESEVDDDDDGYKKDKKSKSKSKGRKHKALFIDYPFVPQLSAMPSYDAYDEIQDTEGRTPAGGGGGGGNGALRKGFQESNIYYIRLPPTPYIFVPGLGYVSQPPTYSTGHRIRPQIGHVRPQLDPYRPHHPRPIYNSPLNEINPFINLPVDFVSNGKPTGVYQWQSSHGYQPPKRPETQIATLDKGPYFFNGRPHSIYLLRPDARPPVHQAIQFPDYQDTNYQYY